MHKLGLFPYIHGLCCDKSVQFGKLNMKKQIFASEPCTACAFHCCFMFRQIIINELITTRLSGFSKNKKNNIITLGGKS